MSSRSIVASLLLCNERAAKRAIKELGEDRLWDVIEIARSWYEPNGRPSVLSDVARAWLRGRFVPAKWRRYPLAYAFVAMPVLPLPPMAPEAFRG